jgi:hypothetical protein
MLRPPRAGGKGNAFGQGLGAEKTRLPPLGLRGSPVIRPGRWARRTSKTPMSPQRFSWSAFVGPRLSEVCCRMWFQVFVQRRCRSGIAALISCKLSARLGRYSPPQSSRPVASVFPPSVDLLALPLSSSVYSHAYPSPRYLRGDITGHGCGLVASGGQCAGSQPPSSSSGSSRSGGATGCQRGRPGLSINVSAGGPWDASCGHSSEDRAGGPGGRRSPGTAGRAPS